MKFLIQITTKAILEGMPEGTKVVEVEADSPAEIMFQMQRRGCTPNYIKDVISHMAPIWGPEFPAWYDRPDKAKIQADLIAVHGAYGYDGKRWVD